MLRIQLECINVNLRCKFVKKGFYDPVSGLISPPSLAQTTLKRIPNYKEILNSGFIPLKDDKSEQHSGNIYRISFVK